MRPFSTITSSGVEQSYTDNERVVIHMISLSAVVILKKTNSKEDNTYTRLE